MVNYDQIERNKNKIVNFGVIILALVVAFQFHKSTNNQVDLLIQQQNKELEKNKVFEDIAVLEKKADVYNKIFVKKDLASIVGIISGIAKDTSVKIISIKPYIEKTLDQQNNSSFLVTLTAVNYHVLGNFISKIENHKDIFLVSGISIDSTESDSNAAETDFVLRVSLIINTIFYL